MVIKGSLVKEVMSYRFSVILAMMPIIILQASMLVFNPTSLLCHCLRIIVALLCIRKLN